MKRTFIFRVLSRVAGSVIMSTGYPQQNSTNSVDNPVDNVDNYFPSSLSPTNTMSPAPMVINKSPLIQFCNKKFSISSKEGK